MPALRELRAGIRENWACAGSSREPILFQQCYALSPTLVGLVAPRQHSGFVRFGEINGGRGFEGSHDAIDIKSAEAFLENFGQHRLRIDAGHRRIHGEFAHGARIDIAKPETDESRAIFQISCARQD